MPWFASQGYHCFALSLRGHGRSGGGRKSHFHQHSEDLAGVVEALPASPVVVAHSLEASSYKGERPRLRLSCLKQFFHMW